MAWSWVLLRLNRVLRAVAGVGVAVACVWPVGAQSQAVKPDTPAVGVGTGDGAGEIGRAVEPASGLTIASWNLTDAASVGALVRKKSERRVWRNTFVPRNRITRGETRLNKTLSGADIVLLQGVNSIRETRKLFPARGWKLILSRAVLKVARGRGPYPRVMPADFATTAVAVRYQIGLRVTGQQHLLELAKPEAKAGVADANAEGGAIAEGGGSPGEAGSGTELSAQAGLAVRVFYKGQTIWLVSVAMGADCLVEEACSARDVLNEWIEDKRDFDIPVVTGGRFYRGGVAEPLPELEAGACVNQAIALDANLKGEVKLVGEAGCIALATLAD